MVVILVARLFLCWLQTKLKPKGNRRLGVGCCLCGGRPCHLWRFSHRKFARLCFRNPRDAWVTKGFGPL